MDINNIFELNKKIIRYRVFQNTSFNDKSYTYVIKCDLNILEQTVPIVVCIPEDWKISLVNIYIDIKDDFNYIPHIDLHGKICLFDTEGVLIDNNLEGIILQSIDRAVDIIEKGLKKENSIDFIEEFQNYWYQLPNKRIAKFISPKNKKIQMIKYSYKKITRLKKEKQIEYIKRQKKQILYISEKIEGFTKWNINRGMERNGIYIYIETEKYIFPPDARKKLSVENFISYLLKKSNIEEIKRLYQKLGSEKVFIFEIKQPNGTHNFLGFMFEKLILKFENNECDFVEVGKCYPISIDLCNKSYLLSRINNNNLFENKKILVIGCGSIGGYLVNELTKMGFENIKLIDDDFLDEENIFRHLLGLEYIGKYKTGAMKEYLDKNIPNLNITCLEQDIQDAIVDESIEFNDYDIIISCVGNHNVNRYINQYVFENEIAVPIVYAWNEVLGIGNHVAYINYKNKGCYECFIGRDEESLEIYDRTSYCKPGQKITRKLSGCGSSFIQYGSNVSLRTVNICIDTITKVFEGRYKNNMIISCKGDDFYFKKAGLILSNKYINQKNDTVEYTDEKFINKKCNVCKVKNENKY